MREIVLDDEQAKALSGVDEEFLVRDRHGRLLGHLRPMASQSESAIMDEAKRRLASDQPRYTTKEVIEHLNSLESE